MGTGITEPAESLGTAIGLLRAVAGGLELDHEFFDEPAQRLAAVLSDPGQREAALRALDLLAPGTVEDGLTHHVLADEGGVRLSVTVSGGSSDAVIGLALRAASSVGVFDLHVPLVAGSGSTTSAVLGTGEHPVTITLANPSGLGATVLLAGPDPVADSRVLVTGGGAVLDPADGATVAAAVTELLGLVLGGDSAAEPAASHLLGALGLAGGIPPLPLAASEPGGTPAWRGWLAALLAGVAAGRPAVVAWLDHLAGLLGGSLVTGAPAPGVPAEVVLSAPDAAAPGLALRLGLSPAGDRAQLGVRSWFAGSGAEVAAEVTLADVPLSGTAPAEVAGACSLLASSSPQAPVYPPPDGPADPSLRVGAVQAGLRLGPGSVIQPVLALTDVHLDLPGAAADVPYLDLTSTDALAEAVAGGLAGAVLAGLGSSPAATALARLAGLLPPPGVPAVDGALLATDPRAAIGDHYRAMRSSPAGWAPVAAALWVLLGGSPAGGDLDAVPVDGTGTADDPWRVPLDHWTGGPAGVALSVCVWEGAPARLCAGLRAAASVTLPDGGSSGDGLVLDGGLLVELLAVDVGSVDVGSVAPSALPPAVLAGSVMATLTVPQVALAPLGDVAVQAGPLAVSFRWQAGSPVAVDVSAGGLSVGQASLAGLAFPGVLDLDAADLGLAGGDAGTLWTVARGVLASAASALGGPARLVTLIAGTGDGGPANGPVASGVSGVAPDPFGLPGLPPVELPGSADLRGGLADPVGVITGWLAGMLAADTGVDAAGRPRLLGLLGWLQAALTGRVEAAPGRDRAQPSDPITGGGTASSPWATPLQPAGSALAFQALTWVDGEGPAADWASAALALMEPRPEPPPKDTADDADDGDTAADEEDTDSFRGQLWYVPPGEDVAAALQALSAMGGPDARMLAYLNGGSVDRLAEELAAGDGVVPSWSAVPAGASVGRRVPATHWGLPSHPDAVRQAAAHVLTCTEVLAGSQWALVAVDAGLARTGAWDPLGAALGLPAPVPVNLRAPGVDPMLVDLGGLAAAPYYLADLADDGVTPVTDLAARLGRIVDAVLAARGDPGDGAGGVVLVAHSWAGLAASALAASRPAGMLGLVTLGTPYGAGAGGLLADPVMVETVLALRALFDGRVGLGSHGIALARLAEAADGWRPGADGAPPVPAPDLAAGLNRATDPEAPSPQGVPTLALYGELPGDLRTSLRLAAWQLGPVAEEPGELAHGVRMALDLGPAAEGEFDVDLGLRLDLGSPAAVQVGVVITVPGGWLLGGPPPDDGYGGTGEDVTPDPVRLRWAELVGRFEAAPVAGDPPVASFEVLLHDAADHGVGARVLTLNDPLGPPVAAALMAELGAQAAFGGRVAALLDLLAGLGLVTGDGAATSLLTDGITALESDPTGTFAAAVEAVLDRPSGAAGLTRDEGARSWRLHHPDLAVELIVTPDAVTVATTGDGLPVAGGGWLTGTTAVSLPDPVATVELRLTGGDTTLTLDGGELRLETPALDGPAVLLPPEDGLLERLAPLAARSLSAAALGGVLGAVRAAATGGHPVPMPWLGRLLRDAGSHLSSWLSGPAGAPVPDAAAVNALLAEVGGLLGAAGPADRPLLLPGGLGCYAAPSTGQPGIRLGLRTGAPITVGGSGSLDLDVWLDVDASRTPTPGGTLRLRLPLDGAPWGEVELTLGSGPDGATLAITPSGLDATVTLLPEITGLTALAGGGAELLLAAVLNALVERLRARPGWHQLLDAALAVAAAFGVYDEATGFDGDRLTALAADLATGAPDATTARQRAQAAAAVLDLLAPGAAATASGSTVTVAGGALTVSADLAGAPPDLTVTLAGATAGTAGASITADVTAGTAAQGSVTLAAAVELGRGVTLRPKVVATPAGVKLRPLGDTTVVLRLAPQAALPTPAQATLLATRLALPLAVAAGLDGLGTALDRPLWAGGPTPSDLLEAAGLITAGGDVITPTPTARAILDGVLGELAGTEIAAGGDLVLALATDGDRYGLALRGPIALPGNGPPVTLHLGLPADVETTWTGADGGLTVYVLDLPGQRAVNLAPALRLDGAGLRAAGERGRPLVDTPALVIGEVGLYGQLELSLDGAPAVVDGPEGAAQLVALGLPLLPADTGSNPVAASLLASDAGDQAPANPPVDVTVASDGGALTVRFGGEPELRLPVQQTFGPLHLDEVALSYDGAQRRVGTGVTGSVAVGPLAIGLADLTVLVPLDTVSDLATWAADLAGLAVSLVTEVVSVSGGLMRNDLPGGDVEYLGALTMSVPGRDLTAIGSYAQPEDALGGYTSLFVFLNVPVPLGGPPFFVVLGLAAGVGYNRRLLVPDDPAAVPTFPLVAAVSGELALGEDPIDGLATIGADMPPARGAFWGAAGVRFTTFGLIQGTALAYLSLDTGVEVGVLGLLQLVLPPPGKATVLSVELGLAASYSTVDQVLSVQAALTDGSWLFTEDCRLTGGFAFMAWLAEPEVLLSIGGYHPDFDPPSHYPAVDRVGFAWTPARGISVKGEAYFALTHSAIMLGGALEASYDVGPVRAWFETSVDVMVTWDPLSYRADLHIGVGAEVEVRACVLVCVTVRLNLHVGADLHIEGPPLRCIASVDLGVTSITVAFGSHEVQAWLDWDEVRRTYLTSGSDTAPATTTTVSSGRLATAEASAPDGTEDDPWLVGTVFALTTDTPMPCTALLVTGSSAGSHLPAGVVAPRDLDVVPAGPSIGPATAVLTVEISRRNATGWEPVEAGVLDGLDVLGIQGAFPSAVWEAGRADEPAAPMLAALGGVTLSATVTVDEVTGALGDESVIPVSRLVQELDQRPLPLGAPAGGGRGRGGWPGPSTPPRRPAPLGRRRPDEPLLVGVATPVRAVLPTPARHTRPYGELDGLPDRHTRAYGEVGGLPNRHKRAYGGEDDAGGARSALPAGGAALWEVRDLPAAELVLDTDRAVRVIALAGTGAPLADLELPAGDGIALGGHLPRGVARLAVTHAAVPASGSGNGAGPRGVGWQRRDDLMRLGEGTFAGHGATVLTGGPVHLPPRYRGHDGDRGPAVVPAFVALTGQDEVTTVFTAPGSVLVLRFDGLPDGHRPQITVDGAELHGLRQLAAGERTALVGTLRRRGGELLRVRVYGAGAGVLAAVVLLDPADGGPAAVVERLQDRPWCSLVPRATAGGGVDGGAEASVRLRRRRRGSGGTREEGTDR